MNLSKVNENLTKGMIGIFFLIFLLSLVAIVLPNLSYIIVGLLYLLLAVTGVTFALSSYLIVKHINQAIEKMFINFVEFHNKIKEDGTKEQ